MDYDFSRLSTRSFEQMIQSLSLAVIGGGVSIFGDGPDGGREATFEDLKNFPEPGSGWSGYGVVQAKFRQRTGRRDAEWALIELNKELKTISKSAQKKPENYIFVTNVVLTPVAEIGSKDRALKLFEKYRSTTGIKNFRIWDYDQLCAMLDAHSEIRAAYQAWITPGDVLSAIIKNIAPERVDFKDVMLNFVQKELRSEQYVNLGQAGLNVKERISVASVFVDLPLERPNSIKRYRSTPEGVLSRSGADQLSALEHLTSLSNQKLDPISTDTRQASLTHSAVIKPPGRVVFIGGPGQGKSTLTQFFCQLHRFAFISQYAKSPVSSEIKDVCAIISEQSTTEKIEIPLIPRFPLRIELNRFAAALANEKTSSLFSYIANKIQERTERNLESADLRKWLASYPWLIALDGLDEVPSSSNRTEVLNSIHDFLIDAHDCNADVLLVATSRPQGYDDDFSESKYEHFRLSELNREQALHYADRLISRRWYNDNEKINILNSRMIRAAQEDSTVRLMKSPLQVTIMALLVESLGEPPKERWRLFNEYYQVINRREKERDIPAAKLINNYQADIDYIHQKVGAKLQVDSEQSGSTDALLSEDDFSSIIIARLEAEGHSGEKGTKFKNEIVEAAIQRLVFLVAPQDGKIGFEIRSLQEFMAAQSITNGNDQEVTERLKYIAHAMHWRNVFLFAAGRCFQERQHLRGSILAVCSELNEGVKGDLLYNVNKVLLSGSRLALDILEDGAISNQPAQFRIFTRLAVRLVELPPSECIEILAKLHNSEVSDLYKSAIEKQLDQPDHNDRLSAWGLLMELVKRDIDWAIEIAEARWPASQEEILTLISDIVTLTNFNWINNKLIPAVFKNSPAILPIHQVPPLVSRLQVADSEDPGWLSCIFEMIRNQSRIDVEINGIAKSDMHFALVGCTAPPKVSSSPDDAHPGWSLLLNSILFRNNPSAAQLSSILYEYASIIEGEPKFSMGHWSWLLPWQVSACINKATTPSIARHFGELASQGFFGDTQDWIEAQTRWQVKGILLEDLNYQPVDSKPFDNNVAKIGMPSTYFFPVNVRPHRLLSVYSDLHLLWAKTSNPDSKKLLSNCMLSSISSLEAQHVFSEDFCEDLHEIFSLADAEWIDFSILNHVPEKYWDDNLAIVKILEVMAKGSHEEYYNVDDIPISKIKLVAKKNLHNKCILSLLANLVTVCCEMGTEDAKFDLKLFKDIESKCDAIVINITQLYDVNKEVEDIACAVLKICVSQGNSLLAQKILSLLERSDKLTAGIELLLYRLYDSHLATDAKLKNRIVYQLQEYHKYHLSVKQSCLL